MKMVSVTIALCALGLLVIGCTNSQEPEVTTPAMNQQELDNAGISEGTAPTAGGTSSQSTGEAPQSSPNAVSGDL